MTIRRRDRGLSGGDMGCDGSWDMSDDLLERLREAPGAGALFDALADVPGVWVVGGAVRDALLGRVPRELDLVVEGDAAAVGARGWGRSRCVHERFGTATCAAATSTSPPRAASATSSRVRCRRCELGATIERGPRAARLHRQRDRGAARRRGAAGEWPGALRGPRGAACCACCTSARSSTTRRGCCGWPATRARLRFADRAGRHASWRSRRSRAARWRRSRASRLGAELRLLLARAAAGGAAAALERHGLGRAAAARLQRRPRRSSSARSADARRRPRRTSWRWPRRCLDASARDARRGASTGSSSPPRERDVVTAAATRARGARAGAGRAGRRVGALGAAAARGGRDRRAGRRAGRRRRPARRWLDDAPPPPARDHRRRPARRRPRRARAIGRGAGAPRTRGDARRRAPRPRARSWRPRWRPSPHERVDARLDRPSAGRTSTSPPTCPARGCCSRPAAAASPRARSPRSTSAG